MLPPMCPYAVQKKAWMDESMMDLWIYKCLAPWKNVLHPSVVLLLILDLFYVHMMGPMVTKIQSLGIKVQHIPGGCTSMCQPMHKQLKPEHLSSEKTGSMQRE